MKTPSPIAEFAGTGRFLPDNIVTNDDLAQRMDTSDEWIRTRTGISERRIAPDEMTAADMGAAAAPISAAEMSSGAIRRSRIPVRVRIHSSDVSIFCARSSFVTMLSGR